MNLAALIRMKEKIAISGDLTPKERDFLLEAVNAVVEHEREIGKLQNPNAVHANMLCGSIAKPSWAQIKHLYPEQFVTEPQAAPELERVKTTMKRLIDTQCMRSGQMDEALLYELRSDVERYLTALALSRPEAK